MKAKEILMKAGLLLTISLVYVNCSWSNNNSDTLISEANRLVSEGNKLVSEIAYQEAEKCFLKSIECWDKVEAYNEYKAYPYYSLALLYRKTGNYQRSIDSYQQAEKILLNAHEEYKFLLGAIYSNMGILFINYGDYVKALFYYNQAIDVYSKLRSENGKAYSEAIYGKTYTYYYLKKYQLSIDLAKNYLINKNALNRSQFEIFIGICLINQGNNDQAIKLLEKSLLGFKNEPDKYSEALLVASKAYLKTGNLQKAEAYLSKALPLLKANKTETDPWNVYYCELSGLLYMAKANAAFSLEQKRDLLAEALKSFDKGLLLNCNSKNGEIPYVDGNKYYFITPTQVKDIFNDRAKVLGLIAENCKKMGDIQLSKQILDMSLNTWEATVRFLNDFRASFLEEESKLSLGESEVNIYTEGFSTARKLYDETGRECYFKKMLYFSESGKSATFLSSLNTVQARNFGGLPDSLLRSEKELAMQITNLKQLIFNGKDSPDSSLVKGWENSLFDIQKKHDELMFRFERDYPSYYAFKYSQKTVSESEITEKLKQGQALLEYFIDEPVSEADSGTVNVLFFTSAGYSIHSTKVGYGYVKSLQTLLYQLSVHDVGETNLADFKDFSRSANYLYSVLVEPLKIETSIKSLIIIPDGKLAYLPFDVLISTMPDTTRISFSKPDYLVRRFNMVYSYSATLHFDYFEGKKHGSGNILAFAPEYPRVEFDINQSAYRKRQPDRAILRPLPGAREEVSALSKYNNCKVCIGNSATETAFKREAANYDILHLAMHTIMNDSIPMYSKLVFSSATDTIDDGYLNTQEIYNMKLNARMAVLSACNTGSGQMRAGEGVMSLARAFLYAGCQSIVMTLWEVEDKSSSRLMLSFYRYLFKGYTKPEALQKAKLEHLENADPLRVHPLFWVGYIVVGDPSTLKYPNGLVISILVFGVFLIILLYYLLKSYSRYKKMKVKYPNRATYKNC